MFCENCGREIPNTVNFCEYCGRPVSDGKSNKKDDVQTNTVAKLAIGGLFVYLVMAGIAVIGIIIFTIWALSYL